MPWSLQPLLVASVSPGAIHFFLTYVGFMVRSPVANGLCKILKCCHAPCRKELCQGFEMLKSSLAKGVMEGVEILKRPPG
jgi:hypothetical protein